MMTTSKVVVQRILAHHKSIKKKKKASVKRHDSEDGGKKSKKKKKHKVNRSHEKSLVNGDDDGAKRDKEKRRRIVCDKGNTTHKPEKKRSMLAKIAIKHGVQLTVRERMAEDFKNLTGGILPSRNRDYLVLYGENNLLSREVAEALVEQERFVRSLQDEKEEARLREGSSALIVPSTEPSHEIVSAGTLGETLDVTSKWGKNLDDVHHAEKVKHENLRQENLVRKLERKLVFAERKLLKAERGLAKEENCLQPAGQREALENITDEVIFMFCKFGLNMKAFLLLGRQGVYDSTVENIHLHWKYKELVKITIKAKTVEGVKKVAGKEDIKNENVDFEKFSFEEVFQQLKCSRDGLSGAEGKSILKLFGPNKLEEKKESKIRKFLECMWNPLSWVMEAASIMAIALANGNGRPPDWQEFVGIVCPLLNNSTISFWEENNAGNIAAAPMAGLDPKTKVLRDGKWSEQETYILVPGDIVSIKLGDIIPADARLVESDVLKVEKSALTGESLPATKGPGEEVFSGFTCEQEIAGMDVLCSDKIETLTLNKISVDKNLIEGFARGVEKEEVLLLAARASRTENQDAIDTAMVGMLADPEEARAGIREIHFFPFNPVEKKKALTYIDGNGDWHRLSKGAPEKILDLCNARTDLRKRVHSEIEEYAERGLRSLAFARQTVSEKTKESSGGPWEFVGEVPLFDPPRNDCADTIRRALDLGVNVKITGDQLAIAKETIRRLGMGSNMYPSCSLIGYENLADIPVEELIEKSDGAASVFPERKYEIVKKLQELKHICGMTGDGVNDAPVLKRADIGIAVSNATDAARVASGIIAILGNLKPENEEEELDERKIYRTTCKATS
ncbi:hypothetical protein Bca4012_058591 [Brassica carinata]